MIASEVGLPRRLVSKSSRSASHGRGVRYLCSSLRQDWVVKSQGVDKLSETVVWRLSHCSEDHLKWTGETEECESERLEERRQQQGKVR